MASVGAAPATGVSRAVNLGSALARPPAPRRLIRRFNRYENVILCVAVDLTAPFTNH